MTAAPGVPASASTPRRGGVARRRLVVGWGILVLWIGLLGWQVRREYFPPELTRLAEAMATLDPGTNFYALRMGGQAIGLSSSRIDTIPEGFVLEDQMTLGLQAMGQPGDAAATTRVVLTPTLRMTEFSFALSTAAGDFSLAGTVQGDTLMEIDIDTGGQVERVTFRVPESPLFTAALPIRLAKGGELRVGNVVRVEVFDPSSVSLRPVEIEVLEESVMVVPDSAILDPGTGRWIAATTSEIPAWRIRERYGGMSLESWIDGDGRVLRSSSPMGFSIERTAYELALQERDDTRRLAGVGGTDVPDVILQTAIAANRDLGNVEQYRELRFVLSGVDLNGFELDGGRQELRGDTLIVRREDWNDYRGVSYDLPYPSMDLRAELAAEPLIQSGDGRIQEEARSIARIRLRERSRPMEAAERLTSSLYANIEKRISFTLPSALQVLETMSGDCNEHTVLYVALARAIGLPARIAVGLVYLDGSFYYHAWPEVWLDEWVAVDPTFGQVPADAAHLRFMTGNLAQQVEIARLIGALRIEVVGAE